MEAVSVRVPGKVTLAGEYAALFGEPILAATVDRYLTVRAETGPGPRPSPAVVASTDLFPGTHRIERSPTARNTLRQTPFADAVASAMDLCESSVDRIDIRSDLDITHGLGSSSALRLGVAMAFAYGAIGDSPGVWDCGRHAYERQRRFQGQASGFDLATQLEGGLVTYRCSKGETWPGTVKSHKGPGLERLAEVVKVVVGGCGAPTKSTMQTTLAWLRSQGRQRELILCSRALVCEVQRVAEYGVDSLQNLIHAVAKLRAVFEGGPNFPRELQRRLVQVPGLDRTWSFKTTGAGGEDAILLVGDDRSLARPIAEMHLLGWSELDARFCADAARAVPAANAGGADA